MAMSNRKKFLTFLTTGLVALVFVIGSAFADELLGVITKVNVEDKKLTVVEKDTDKEIEVTVTADTDYEQGKNKGKIDLEKVSKNLAKAQDAGRKGINVTVTHEKGTASKIVVAAKKKAAAVPAPAVNND